ncbi:MAG: DoxX family protein [Chlamydiales bacterium]|nr:DoxX family protein [Chlamydiales bacterium]
MKRKSKHLLVIRLAAGIIFFFFGFFHLLNNENFTNLLRVAEIPLVYFNAVFIPLTDFLVGLFLILGLFTRYAAVIGFLFSAFFVWITLHVMHINPSQVPDGLAAVPFYPPVFITIIICLFTLYIACLGGGAYTLDNRMQK